LLQMCLGVSIMYTIGNNDEAYRALKRALGLAEKLDDPYYQLHTLETLGNFYQRTADMRGVRAIAIRGESVIKVLASRTGHVHTNWMMASSYQLTGDQANARKSAEVAIRNTSPARRVRRFAVDRRNNAMITLARALWMQGYPEQAIAAARDVLAEARSVNHSIMLCIALHWMTSVSIWSGALAMADELIAALIDRADKFALPSFHARALGWNGTLSLQRGNTDDAIRLLRSSLESLDAVRDQQMKTAFHSELAEALALAGHRDESLAEIDEVIARIGRTGEGMFLPEALRRKGDILTLGTVSDATIADECFKQSIAHARRQGALSWELRTATSFARLRHRQGRRDEARAILAPVYSRFSEGFGTADLRAARHLLDEHP
jgi:tetratricopeptide (TPR) repeat protein